MTGATAAKELPGSGEKYRNGFELRPTPAGTVELKLWGRFPPGWAGALTGGLSRKGIGVIRGSARKVNTSWEAVFEMDTSRCAADPNRIDYLALAMDDRCTEPGNGITVSDFFMGDPEKDDGALLLEVSAPDQLGFLAALLNRLAFLFLFPEEMSIETVNGRAVDRFRLKGIGGNPPSATARAALLRKLQVLVVN